MRFWQKLMKIELRLFGSEEWLNTYVWTCLALYISLSFYNNPSLLCVFYEAFAKFLAAKIFILVTFIPNYLTLPVKFKLTITRFHLTWRDQLSRCFDQNWIDFYHP